MVKFQEVCYFNRAVPKAYLGEVGWMGGQENRSLTSCGLLPHFGQVSGMELSILAL